MNNLLNIIVAVIIIVWIGYIVYWYVMSHKAAKFIDANEFNELSKAGQLVDLRDPSEYRNSHIMGARNIAFQMFAQSFNALRKDRPVILYDATTRFAKRAAVKLHKEGYQQVYILKGGFTGWQGKKATKH